MVFIISSCFNFHHEKSIIFQNGFHDSVLIVFHHSNRCSFFFIFITFYHVASASSFSIIFIALHPSLSLSSLFIVSDCSSLLTMIVYDFASVFIMLYHFQYFPCFHDFHDSSSFSSFSSFSAFSFFDYFHHFRHVSSLFIIFHDSSIIS